MSNKSIVWRDEAVAAIAASYTPNAERAKEVIMDAQLAVMGLPEAVPEKKQSKGPDMIGGMRACPFCGKIWWKYDNIRREIETSDRGDRQNLQADSKRERCEKVEHCNVD